MAASRKLKSFKCKLMDSVVGVAPNEFPQPITNAFLSFVVFKPLESAISPFAFSFSRLHVHTFEVLGIYKDAKKKHLY